MQTSNTFTVSHVCLLPADNEQPIVRVFPTVSFLRHVKADTHECMPAPYCNQVVMTSVLSLIFVQRYLVAAGGVHMPCAHRPHTHFRLCLRLRRMRCIQCHMRSTLASRNCWSHRKCGA